ncbi:MAG: hypothetical protein P8Y70_03495 [Candidatus Lokiarchaeota archaeon]
MEKIKDIIDDIGNAALEENTKIASLAIISNSGKVIHQTKNFDLTNQTDVILDIINGDNQFILNNSEFDVTYTSSEGIIGTNKNGMGYVIILPFQGGVLVSYVMPKADPIEALNFLKTYTKRLNGKVS